MQFFVFLMGVWSVWGNALANTEWVLTEEALVEKIYQESTLVSRIQSAEASAQSQRLDQTSGFHPVWKSQAYYQNSNEKGLASFIPTFGPTYGFSTGIAQKFSYGIDLQADVFGDLTSTADGFIDKATRTGVRVTANMNLLKNFMGRVDQAQLMSRELQVEKTQIQNRMDMRVFELAMRKHFWSLVSIEEKVKVANALLETAKLQYKDSLGRQRNYIADVSDTQRYKAQVADRKSTLYTLAYQKDLLLQQIKRFIPSLAAQSIVFGPYDREQTTSQVLICVAQIKTHEQTPWEHTLMDELLAVIEEDYKQRQVIEKTTSGADLALQTQIQSSGVDRGFGDSFTDFTSSGRAGFQVGVVLDVPLGKSKKRAEMAKLKASHQQFVADQKETKATVSSQQSQLTSLVDTLFASMKNYKENNMTLQDNVYQMQKKYKQARIDVLDLVREQDALSQNALSEIDAHLAIMHILLDYFAIFTEDPCPINQMHVPFSIKREA